MQIITLNPDSSKASLLRLAFSSISEKKEFKFTFNSTTYTLSLFSHQFRRYSLVVQSKEGTTVHSELKRGEVLQLYFKTERDEARNRLPNNPEGVVFYQING